MIYRALQLLNKQKTPIYFVNSTLLGTLIGLMTGFITYRYVAPDYLGIWVTLTTFTVYSTFLRLGIPNGMNRELPYFFGQGETEKAYTAAETTFAYSNFITVLLAILSLGFIFFFDFEKYGNYEFSYRQAMYVIIFNVLSEPYSTYLSGTFRTNNNFKKLSDIQMIMSLVKLVSIVFVYYWGFQGYLLREFVSSFINLVLLHIWRPLPNIKSKFSFPMFKNLFSVGFRIFSVSYAASFIGTLPRLHLINEGTSKELGLFSPIIMILGIVALIPNTLTQYLYPKFSYAFGANSDRSDLWKKIRLILILSIVISIIGSIIIYISIDYIILIFPKYTESIPYIKLACLPLLFVGYNLGNVLLVVFKEWKWLWVYTILLGVLQISSLYFISSYINDTLKTVILSLLITYFGMYLYSIAITYKITHQKTI